MGPGFSGPLCPCLSPGVAGREGGGEVGRDLPAGSEGPGREARCDTPPSRNSSITGAAQSRSQMAGGRTLPPTPPFPSRNLGDLGLPLPLEGPLGRRGWCYVVPGGLGSVLISARGHCSVGRPPTSSLPLLTALRHLGGKGLPFLQTISPLPALDRCQCPSHSLFLPAGGPAPLLDFSWSLVPIVNWL